MFLGRKNELDSLENLYQDQSFQMVVVYGRRRVGKTCMLMEFCKNKRAAYYIGIEQNDTMALALFSQSILQLLPEASAYTDGFSSWSAAFSYIAQQSHDTSKERITLVIDEFPYIAAGNPSLLSQIQRSIDLELHQTNIFLVFCGSTMSFMEHQVLGYQSPLYGRRTAQLKINPFDYADAALFFPKATKEEQILAYGVTGGVPYYLAALAKSRSVHAGIVETLLNPSGLLFEEPGNLLKQELREPALYNSIIESIANGASRPNDIVSKTHEQNGKISKYLNSLQELSIIQRITPFGKNSRRKSVYRITDALFRFWYRFIPQNMANIIAGNGKEVFEKKIEPELSTYLGHIFEDVCRQYLTRINQAKKLPFWIDGMGTWWGPNPIRHREEEIDIIAASGSTAMFCECKWRQEPLDMPVFQTLVERSALLPFYETRYYGLFSKSGFTETILDTEKSREDVFLFTLNDLFAGI